MNIKRVLASGIAALMAGSTLAVGGLGQNATNATTTTAAATSLSWTVADSADSWLSFAATDASGGSVTLAGAAETEVLAVANGLDLAKTTFTDAVAKVRDVTTGAIKPATTAGGSQAGTAGGGTTKHVNFGAGTAGGTQLSAGVSAFPTGVWTQSVVPQLWQGKISLKGSDYDAKEIMSATAVRMRNDAATNNINGTSTMEVESGDVYFAYRFDKAINVSTANGKGLKETTDFEFTDPIEITFLGKKFSIIAIAAGKIVVLNGAIGKSVTDTVGVSYTTAAGKAYTVYAIQGSDNSWAKVSVKDSTGAEVAQATINKGSTKDFDAQDITVEVTAVRATQDNKISGADLVVGPKGKTKKTIDTTADVTSTGTSNDALFEGFPEWGLESSGTLATGQAEVNDELRLIYKPSSTQYLKIGQSLKAPNKIVFKNVGYNTKSFAKITFEPVVGVSALNLSDTAQSFGNLNGIQIASDVASSVGGSAGNYYSKMAILFNRTRGPTEAGNPDADHPVFIAYYDGSNWKTNGTVQTVTSYVDGSAQGRDAMYFRFNGTVGPGDPLNGRANYTFRLNYGGAAERTWFVNTTIAPTNYSTLTHLHMIVGRAAATGDTGIRYGINISWRNKTTWLDTAAPEWRLGPNTGSSDDDDLRITTEATAETTGTDVGKKTQDELVDNSGLIAATPSTYTASDKVVLKLPDKELQAAVYVGSEASAGTPAFATTADVVAQVKAGTLTKNLILVGGPCANEVVEYLAGTSATDGLPTCKEWMGGATPKYTKGLVGVWAVGTKKALVLAGTAKADTDAFANDFKLKGTTTVLPV